MRVSSDQFAARLAGVEIAIAVMRGQTPDLSHQWEEVESDRPTYATFRHPDESVLACVTATVRTLDGVALVPGIMSRTLYVRKP